MIICKSNAKAKLSQSGHIKILECEHLRPKLDLDLFRVNMVVMPDQPVWNVVAATPLCTVKLSVVDGVRCS